jgi:hypothetical protein
MTQQASSLRLKLDYPSQELRRHLENFHTSKAKLNFGFREANSHQAFQLATSTKPFVALEADNPEAEDAKDNHEDLREG